ncbi:hypothetical protein RAD15_42745 [Bradyrhizobium sp. 14AA]
MRMILVAIAFIVGASAVRVEANEVEGFRLGMSMQQVSQLALEKGYKFSNPIKSSEKWMSYLLMKDGPNLSFCGDVLSSVGKSYESNLHEFANLLTRWKSSLGEPEVEATQDYVSGSQLSKLRYIWLGEDNVRRDISFWQYSSQPPQISFGYSYVKHPCSAGVKSR